MAVVLVFAVLFTSQSFALDGERNAAKLLGQYDALYQGLPNQKLGSKAEPSDDRILVEAKLAGAPQASVRLSARLLDGDPRYDRVTYIETPFKQFLPPETEIVSGNLPSNRGEACVTDALSDRLPLGTTVNAYRGALPFTVTCILRERLLPGNEAIFAAPGGWQAAAGRQYRGTMWRWDSSATRDLLFNSADPQAIANHLDAAFSSVDGTRNESSGPASGEGQGSSIVTASDLSNTERTSSTGLSNPWFFEIPRWMLPLVGGVLIALLSARMWRRSERILKLLGLPSREISRARLAASSVASIIGAMVGVVAGIIIGVLIRWAIAVIGNREVGPVVGIWSTAGIAVAFACIGSLAGWGILQVTAIRHARRTTSPATKRRAVLFGSVLVAFALWLVARSLSGNIATESNLFAAGLAFACSGVALLPSLFLLLHGVRFRTLPEELGRRQVLGNSLTPLFIVLIAGLSTLATSTSALLATSSATSNASQTSEVPQGQAWLQFGTWPDRTHVKELAAEISRTSGAVPHPYRLLDVDAGGNGPVYSYDSVRDIEGAWGRKLSAEDRKQIESGAMLSAHSVGEGGRQLRGPDDSVLATVPVVLRDAPSQTMSTNGGLLLSSTADKFHLPPASAGYLFYDLTPEQQKRMEQIPNELAFSAEWFQTYRTPDILGNTPQVDAATWGIAGLSVLVCALLSLVIGRVLRPSVAGLWAIGLRRSWLTRSLAFQLVLIAGFSTIVGLGLGILGTLSVASQSGVGFIVDIPWKLCGIMLLGTALGVMIGITLNLRKLSPQTLVE